MSRIRGIQKEVLQTRKYSHIEILKQKNEDQSSNSKDDVEKHQIKELLHKLPQLDKIFDVHRKIGEGTFSSVYLGSLRRHAGLPGAARRWFAIKHLVPTAHPARVQHELRCLQDMGGREHVIGVELCLRHLDTIVFVMPYIPHTKFSEYVGEMDAGELRQYMRALLLALRHVHSFGVIHRDVKPSNFLYDRVNKRYLLVDFGLAQRLCPAPAPPEPPPPAPAPQPPPAHAHQLATRKRPHDCEDLPNAKRVALDLTVGSAARAIVSRACGAGGGAAGAGGGGAGAGGGGAGAGGGGGAGAGGCACAAAGGVCGACAARPPARAPRAGTQGFRPPEVLLKYPHQTTAVDAWAAGVVLASALTARYPFFRAADDVSALAELADLVGTEPLQRAAESLGRRVVMSSARRGLCLRKLAARLRGPPPPPPPPAAAPARACRRCRLPADQCLCRDETREAEEFVAGASVAGFPDAAFALAALLLQPDPRRRASAAAALRHPFLAAEP